MDRCEKFGTSVKQTGTKVGRPVGSDTLGWTPRINSDQRKKIET